MDGGKIAKNHKKLLSSAAQLKQSSLAGWKKTINNQWLEGDLASQFSAIAINIILTADRLLRYVMFHLNGFYSCINTLNK